MADLTADQQQTLESIQAVYRDNHRLRKALRQIDKFCARFPGVHMMAYIGDIAAEAIENPDAARAETRDSLATEGDPS